VVVIAKLLVDSLRLQHGFTIRELAELSGVSKSVVGHICSGVIKKLNIKQAEGFCRAFNCKLSDLYKDDYYDDK